MLTNSKLILGLIITAGLAMPTMASAATTWQKHHPERTEINQRIRTQNHRITQERREGDLTKPQAQALRAQDKSVLQQERADARANGNHGHLNGAQVNSLNAELNANSGAIGK